MSIYEFCNLACDDLQECRVYDMAPEVEREIFKGSMRELMLFEDCADCEVQSFELYSGTARDCYTPYIIFNIDTSEEE